LIIRDENEMRGFGAGLITACDHGGVITLSGELGSGKTTLVRGALEAEGVNQGVRSPTYTLVEYYPLHRFAVAHFDLYRLADAEELEYLGFRCSLRKFFSVGRIHWSDTSSENLLSKQSPAQSSRQFMNWPG